MKADTPVEDESNKDAKREDVEEDKTIELPEEQEAVVEKKVIPHKGDPYQEQSAGSPEVTVERLIEFKWPVDFTGEYYLLVDQVVEFLEEPLLLKKYSGTCYSECVSTSTESTLNGPNTK